MGEDPVVPAVPSDLAHLGEVGQEHDPGIGLASANAVAFGLAVAWHEEFSELDKPTSSDRFELAELGNRTNAATGAAIGLATAGAVCIGVAVVTIQLR